MIYIETGSTDVYYNFGLEHYFATEKRLPDTVFLFWRTTPTLMVGKYQNILEEINKPYADAHGIHLVRRMSGGGTIYTDLGGWQFTFIEHSPDQQIEFAQYIGPVVDAVRELGADADLSFLAIASLTAAHFVLIVFFSSSEILYNIRGDIDIQASFSGQMLWSFHFVTIFSQADADIFF